MEHEREGKEEQVEGVEGVMDGIEDGRNHSKTDQRHQQ